MNDINKMELGILGLLMAEPNAIAVAMEERLDRDWFSSPIAGEIYEAISTRSSNLEGTDLVSMMTVFPQYQEELAEMDLEATGKLHHLREWIAQLRKRYSANRLTAVCKDAINKTGNANADPVEIGNSLLDSVFEVVGNAGRTHIPAMKEVVAELARRRFTDDDSNLVPIFPAYTEAGEVVKVERGNFYCIAAETKGGKTSIAVSMALNANKAGQRVIYFVNETSTNDLGDVFLEQLSGVRASRKKETLSPIEVSRIKDGLKYLADNADSLKIIGLDAGSLTPAVVMGHLRQFAQGGTVDLCVIDYLQRFRADKPTGNDYSDLNTVIKELHQLFIQFNCAGLVLVQFNRQYAQRDQRQKQPQGNSDTPTVAMLKGSSLIEQEANAIAWFYHPGGDKSQTILECNISRKYDPYCISLQYDGTRYISYPIQKNEQ